MAPRLLNPTHRQIGALSTIDLRNMQMFRQVADAGGITAAVERFGIEKTAASRAVRALELRLDGSLCARGPKGFALTDYGREVYAAAAAMDDALDTARNLINRAHQTLEGEVRFGLCDNCLTNTDAKISDAIELFQRMAPSVRLSLSIYPPDQLVQAIGDREVHLGVTSAEHATGETLVGEPLFLEKTRLYCCPQPGEPAPHLHRLATRGYGVVVRRFTKEGPGRMSRRIAAAWTSEASGLEAVATLINTGRCVGLLPDHFVEGTRMRRPFIVVPGSDELITSTVFSVVHERDRIVSQAVSALRDVLIDVARKSGTAAKARAMLG